VPGPGPTLHLGGAGPNPLPVWTDAKATEVVEINMAHVLPAGTVTFTCVTPGLTIAGRSIRSPGSCVAVIT
jgi:hypothetical protein